VTNSVANTQLFVLFGSTSGNQLTLAAGQNIAARISIQSTASSSLTADGLQTTSGPTLAKQATAPSPVDWVTQSISINPGTIAVYPEARLVSSLGAQTVPGTLGSSANWAAAVATYKRLVTGWDTYQEGCSTLDSTFDSGTNNVVCAKGTMSNSSGFYQAVLYDGGNTRRLTDSSIQPVSSSIKSGDHNLSVQCSNCIPGVWHSSLYPNSAAPESTYAGTSDAILADHAFQVTSQALPDLPTPLAAMLACLGSAITYGYLRRRVPPDTEGRLVQSQER